MRILTVLVVIAILTAPAGWYFAAHFLNRDRAAQAELEELRDQFRTLVIDFNALQQSVSMLEQRGIDSTTTTYSDSDGPAEDSLRDMFAQVVHVADRRDVNVGLTAATPSYLLSIFGPPRENLTDDCLPMTNPMLADMVQLVDVGPIRVQLLEPAVISLRQIFRNVQTFEPELYARIESSGSLCVRRVRGSETSVSNHSYGLAVDLNIDGQLDTLGDGMTQLGLTLLADFFHKEGWYWGAGFSREDSMHFEVSREKIEQWQRLGMLPTTPWTPGTTMTAEN